MASSLNEASLEKKMMAVTNTQESIQTLSLWCIHHKAHHKKIVAMWTKVFKKSKPSHRLALYYVANDVIQNSKRKGNNSFSESWGSVLRETVLLTKEDKIKPQIARIFKIWADRNVFETDFITDLQAILENSDSFVAAQPSSSYNETVLAEFKPQALFEKIRKLKTLECDSETKLQQLSSFQIDVTSTETLRQLKDRAHGTKFTKEFEEATNKLEECVEAMEKEVVERKGLLEILELGEAFFESQRGEAKIVANAYKNFGSRVRNLQKKLLELRGHLPSPVPSPTTDAPSPEDSSDGESPTQNADNKSRDFDSLVGIKDVTGAPASQAAIATLDDDQTEASPSPMSPDCDADDVSESYEIYDINQDNTEAVDMEMSDEEGALCTLQVEDPEPGSPPSPEGSPVGLHLPFSPKPDSQRGNSVGAISRTLSTTPSVMTSLLDSIKGSIPASTSSMSSLDSRLSNLMQNIPNLSPAIHSSLFDQIATTMIASPQVEAVDGSDTPLKDEASRTGSATPLQDEEDREASDLIGPSTKIVVPIMDIDERPGSRIPVHIEMKREKMYEPAYSSATWDSVQQDPEHEKVEPEPEPVKTETDDKLSIAEFLKKIGSLSVLPLNNNSNSSSRTSEWSMNSANQNHPADWNQPPAQGQHHQNSLGSPNWDQPPHSANITLSSSEWSQPPQQNSSGVALDWTQPPQQMSANDWKQSPQQQSGKLDSSSDWNQPGLPPVPANLPPTWNQANLHSQQHHPVNRSLSSDWPQPSHHPVRPVSSDWNQHQQNRHQAQSPSQPPVLQPPPNPQWYSNSNPSQMTPVFPQFPTPPSPVPPPDLPKFRFLATNSSSRMQQDNPMAFGFSSNLQVINRRASHDESFSPSHSAPYNYELKMPEEIQTSELNYDTRSRNSSIESSEELRSYNRRATRRKSNDFYSGDSDNDDMDTDDFSSSALLPASGNLQNVKRKIDIVELTPSPTMTCSFGSKSEPTQKKRPSNLITLVQNSDETIQPVDSVPVVPERAILRYGPNVKGLLPPPPPPGRPPQVSNNNSNLRPIVTVDTTNGDVSGSQIHEMVDKVVAVVTGSGSGDGQANAKLAFEFSSDEDCTGAAKDKGKVQEETKKSEERKTDENNVSANESQVKMDPKVESQESIVEKSESAEKTDESTKSKGKTEQKSEMKIDLKSSSDASHKVLNRPINETEFALQPPLEMFDRRPNFGERYPPHAFNFPRRGGGGGVGGRGGFHPYFPPRGGFYGPPRPKRFAYPWPDGRHPYYPPRF